MARPGKKSRSGSSSRRDLSPDDLTRGGGRSRRAYRWYEKQRAGLGGAFLERVNETFQRIAQQPESHALAYRTVRRTLVRQFPYIVCYVFENGCVEIVAVFHGHRNSTAWQSRLKG